MAVNVTPMRGPLPGATVERLPRYLRCIEQLPPDRTTISSKDLALLSNMSAAGVRKDLSFLGSSGIRGVGYPVDELAARIRAALGLTRDREVVVIGVGNLGSALANYGGFWKRGFKIVGLYDADPAKVGAIVGGIEVRSVDTLARDARKSDIAVAIIATPAKAAQEVATLLSRAGIPSILNFAPAVLTVPEKTHLRQVDLATELQILSYYLAGRLGR